MLMISAAAAIMARAGMAYGPSIRIEGSTAHIRVSDLDLDSSSGRLRLARRIRVAAETLCLDGSVDPIAINVARAECYNDAVANGKAQMNALTLRVQ